MSAPAFTPYASRSHDDDVALILELYEALRSIVRHESLAEYGYESRMQLMAGIARAVLAKAEET